MQTNPTYRRIEEALARPGYFVPTDQVEDRFRDPLSRLADWMARPDFDGDLAEAMVRRWRDEGLLDDERMWSALSVVCTHPAVRRYQEASRCIALQESAALDRGGPELDRALASVERHRGVLAWSMGRPSVALECFVRALERERSAENLGNVLAALVKTGEIDHARGLLDQVRDSFPPTLSEALGHRVAVDDDLLALR